MRTNACSADVKELALIYDEDNLSSYVSLYYDGKDDKFIEHREQAVRAALKGKELENFVKTMNKVKKYLERTKPVNVAIFASSVHDYFRVVSLPAEVKNALVVDASPYVRYLAEMIDKLDSFTLVLLNSNHAKIFSVSCGCMLDEEEMSAHIMNKHKKGGMSQARFQRLRKGSIHSFLSEVATKLQKVAGRNIIIAGPGQAKSEFLDMLPKTLQASVVSVVDVDMKDEHRLLEESFAIAAEKGEEERDVLLQHLYSETLKDGLAVHGVEATLEAAEDGRIEVLLVERDFKLRGWECEHCQTVGSGVLMTCPTCGNRTVEVDVVEEVVEFAERTDAVVEFTVNPEMGKLGGVAALLRYK